MNYTNPCYLSSFHSGSSKSNNNDSMNQNTSSNSPSSNNSMKLFLPLQIPQQSISQEKAIKMEKKIEKKMNQYQVDEQSWKEYDDDMRWLLGNSEILRDNSEKAKKDKILSKVTQLVGKSQWKAVEALLVGYMPLKKLFPKMFDLDESTAFREKDCFDVENMFELKLIQKALERKNSRVNNNVILPEVIPQREIHVSKYSYTRALYHMVYSLMEQEKYSQVVKIVEHSLNRNPISIFSRFERIEVWKILRKLDSLFCETIACFDLCYLPKDVAKCYRNFGFYYIEKQCYEKAVACLCQSLKYEVHISVLQELYHIQNQRISAFEQTNKERYHFLNQLITLLKTQMINFICENELVQFSPQMLQFLPAANREYLVNSYHNTDQSYNTTNTTEQNNTNNAYRVRSEQEVNSESYQNNNLINTSVYQIRPQTKSIGYEPTSRCEPQTPTSPYSLTEAVINQQKQNKKRYLKPLQFPKDQNQWIMDHLDHCIETFDGRTLKVSSEVSKTVLQIYEELIESQETHEKIHLGSINKGFKPVVGNINLMFGDHSFVQKKDLYHSLSILKQEF